MAHDSIRYQLPIGVRPDRSSSLNFATKFGGPMNMTSTTRLQTDDSPRNDSSAAAATSAAATPVNFANVHELSSIARYFHETKMSSSSRTSLGKRASESRSDFEERARSIRTRYTAALSSGRSQPAAISSGAFSFLVATSTSVSSHLLRRDANFIDTSHRPNLSTTDGIIPLSASAFSRTSYRWRHQSSPRS